MMGWMMLRRPTLWRVDCWIDAFVVDLVKEENPNDLGFN